MMQNLRGGSGHSTNREILGYLWNLNLYWHGPECPPRIPILSPVNPVYIAISYLLKFNFNVTPTSKLRSLKCSLPLWEGGRYLHQLYLSRSKFKFEWNLPLVL
jgi:hypothetical protein